VHQHLATRSAWLLLILGLCLPLGAHSTDASGEQLRRLQWFVARSGTGLAPRLSISPSDRTGGAPRLSRPLARLLGHTRGQSTRESMHVLALGDLLWVDAEGHAAVRAVEQLQMATEAAPPSAALLSDLAAAYLVRAEHGGSLLDLHQALEAAGRALEMDSTYPPARYNLALTLDRLMLDTQATVAWRAAVAADPASAWGGEAALQVRRLTAPRPPWRSAERPLAESASRFPQEARQFAMDTLLGHWGEAVLRRDPQAGAYLRDADVIGTALVARGGDRSVADLVSAIQLHSRDSAATARLARAHALYARAQGYVEVRRGSAALTRWDSIPDVKQASPVLALWMRYWRGVSLFYADRGKEATPLFADVLQRVDTVRQPALAGRVLWSLGTPFLRAGDYSVARDRFSAAARLFTRAGEREHLGSVQELQAEALFGLGDEEQAYARMRDGLETLRPYRCSQWLHNLLYSLSQAATVRGLNHASVWLQEEDVAVAMAVPHRPGLRAEALLARARSLTAAGTLDRAQRDIDRARALLDSIESPYEQNWQATQLRFAQAGMWVRTHPERAVTMLDSVLGFYRGNVSSRAVASFAYRADARLSMSQLSGATADLDSAAALIGGFTTSIRDVSERAVALANGRRVFERLVMLYVRQGRPADALATLERARVAFGEGDGARDAVPGVSAAPPGQVVVDYALAGDTLLTFVLRGRVVQLHRQTLDGAELAATARRARTALERHAGPGELHPPLELLFDRLIRPIAAWLRSGEPVVLVADGELGEIPFAALRDSSRNQFLVQRHVLRNAFSLADAVRTGQASSAAASVFVADPEFSAAEHPTLPRLPHSATEVQRISQAYPRPIRLVGPAAGRDTLLALLPRARLFHFAGHAIFDADRPSRSYLVVASRPGEPGRIGPAALDSLDLGGVRLVVLSACETQRSATGRPGGFAGLSEAFLEAGAGGVVGSLWKVREESTQALMEEFHRAWRASGDAAAALRTAQLRLLASPEAALRSPAAWAGFRYAGT
jgi:CHAT domain-containing protein/tetratricopeptide (TPR) repeat protein